MSSCFERLLLYLPDAVLARIPEVPGPGKNQCLMYFEHLIAAGNRKVGIFARDENTTFQGTP
jgi:hypothetical protein